MSTYMESKFVGIDGSRSNGVYSIARLIMSDDELRISVVGIHGTGKTWCIRRAFNEAAKGSCIDVYPAEQWTDVRYDTPIEAIMAALGIDGKKSTVAREKAVQEKLAAIVCRNGCKKHKVALWLPMSNQRNDSTANPPAKKKPQPRPLGSVVKFVFEQQIESGPETYSEIGEINQHIRLHCFTSSEVKQLISSRLDPTIGNQRNWIISICKEVGRHPGLLNHFLECNPDQSVRLQDEVGNIFDAHSPLFVKFYKRLRESLQPQVRQDLECLLENRHCENPDLNRRTQATGLVYCERSNGSNTIRPTRLLQKLYDEWRKSEDGHEKQQGDSDGTNPAPAGNTPGERDAMQRVLSIGINQYDSPFYALSWAVNDATEFADVFTSDESHAVTQLIDGAATKTAIMNALQDLAERSRGNDTVVIFFAGHGMHDDTSNYLCPSGANPDNPQETLIYKDELSSALQEIKVAHLAVFLDACHAGGTAQIRGASETLFRPGMQDDVVRAIAKDWHSQATSRNVAIIAACGADRNELSYESRELKHGYFTYYLLKGLHSKASPHDRLVSILRLASFVSEEVPRATSHLGAQQPFHHIDGQDFWIITSGMLDPHHYENGEPKLSTDISVSVPKDHVQHGETLTITVDVTPRDVGSHQFKWRTSRGTIVDSGRWVASNEATYTAPSTGSFDLIYVKVREGSLEFPEISQRINLVHSA